MDKHIVLSDDEVSIIELYKTARIIILSPNTNNTSIKNLDFPEVIEQIKTKINLFFNDKILYSPSNNDHYLLSLTSALILDGVEPLKTPQRSKALKLIKRKL